MHLQSMLPQFAQYKSVNKKFKLNLCKDFENTQKCPMDIRCHYAHGKHELRKFDDILPSQLHPDQLAVPVIDSNPNNEPRYQNNLIYDKNIQAQHYNQYLEYLEEQKKKLTKYKIQYVLYCIDQMNNKDNQLDQQISEAQEQWKNGNYDQAINSINQIAGNQNQNDEERQRCQQVIAEAEQLSLEYFVAQYCKKFKVPLPKK